jgi:hypothetical protein
MGLLFRKHLRLSKWLSLNLSKSGLGLSVGPPGAKLSVNQKRARVQLGVPGTGLGYRRDMSLPQDATASPARRSWPWAWLLLIGVLLAAWWLFGCAAPTGVIGGTVNLFNPDLSRARVGTVGR